MVCKHQILTRFRWLTYLFKLTPAYNKLRPYFTTHLGVSINLSTLLTYWKPSQNIQQSHLTLNVIFCISNRLTKRISDTSHCCHMNDMRKSIK